MPRGRSSVGRSQACRSVQFAPGFLAWIIFEMSDQISQLLTAATEMGASDLHLIVGVPPAFRINGEIIFAEADCLPGDQITEMAYCLLSEDQRETFEREWELCISLPHSVAGRVRATLYRRNTHPEMSIRFCGD